MANTQTTNLFSMPRPESRLAAFNWLAGRGGLGGTSSGEVAARELQLAMDRYADLLDSDAARGAAEYLLRRARVMP